MTDLERIARQYVAENKLTLGEQLALSVFVAKAREVLEPKQEQRDAAEGVTDFQRGWRLV